MPVTIAPPSWPIVGRLTVNLRRGTRSPACCRSPRPRSLGTDPATIGGPWTAVCTRFRICGPSVAYNLSIETVRVEFLCATGAILQSSSETRPRSRRSAVAVRRTFLWPTLPGVRPYQARREGVLTEACAPIRMSGFGPVTPTDFSSRLGDHLESSSLPSEADLTPTRQNG